jgi:hypothetical protein
MVALGAPSSAQADPTHSSYNGLASTPPMGFNDWNAFGCNVSASLIEQTALAMHTNGMQAAGYNYVNIDDCWMLGRNAGEIPPGQTKASAGRGADGHLIADPTYFPPSAPGRNDGIKVVADYVHSLGLKLGLYEEAGTATCQGLAGSYGHETTDAQDFADWGVDYLKYDNCNAPAGTASTQQEYIDRYKAMSDALAATGRPIVYALCEWGNFSPWQWGPTQANLGRSTGDISANYASMLRNFTINAENPPSPDAPLYFNDPDMLETGTGNFSTLAAATSAGATGIKVASTSSAIVGGVVRIGTAAAGDLESAVVTNVGTAGAAGTGLTLDGPLKMSHPSGEQINKDGMTLTEEQTEQTLWAAEAAPLLAGTDVVNMAPQDLAIYENPDVIAVDQDSLGMQASVVSNANGRWVLSKPLADGSRAVVLFNANGAAQTITTSASALGLPGGYTGYNLNDLWTHQSTETAGVIGASVPAHAAVMYRVTPINNPTQAPPDVTFSVDGPTSVTAGQPVTVTGTFTDNGVLPAQHVKLNLTAPAGWTVTPTSAASFGAVESGQAVQSTFQVVPPAPSGLFESDQLTAAANYTWPGGTPQSTTSTTTVMYSPPPVQAPYQTFSSATDAPAVFGQLGQQFGISGAGADLYSGNDAYSTIYLPGSVGTTSTIDTEVVSQQNMNGFAKAGILVRNSMTGSGTTPEGVILFASPSGGMQLEWNNNGGTFIRAVTPPNGTIPESLPVWLRLVRNGSTYAGYYSLNNQNWKLVGSATLSAQADTQDAGLFVTSHTSGSPGQVTFNGFNIAAAANPPTLTN